MKALFTLIIGIFLILSYQNGFAQDSVKVAEDSVKLIDNNFNGKMVFDRPETGTAGKVFFFGSNTTIGGGLSVASGVDTTGRATKYRVYGEAHFDGSEGSKQVFVRGMPEKAVVTVTYKYSGPVLSGDAVMAVIVNDGGRGFTVWRSSINNTENLPFYWNAEWDEEDDE
jgi:hypothetical protein